MELLSLENEMYSLEWNLLTNNVYLVGFWFPSDRRVKTCLPPGGGVNRSIPICPKCTSNNDFMETGKFGLVRICFRCVSIFVPIM